MIIFTTILICITIAVGLVYLFTIAMFGFGWLSIPSLRYQKSESYIFASVIIPVRNEKNNIIRCLEGVLAQHYQPDYFEIIIVDDHSTDNTSDIIKSKYSSCKNIILISNQGQGKKDAITSAIKIAKGEIIITLDADCVVEQHWLASFIEYYKATNAKMIVGSVKLLYSHSVFTRMQSLEFMALSLTTGGALAFKNAVLCNGANLAFTSEVFNQVNGYQDIDSYATGDDVLLMYKINQQFPQSIKFLKSRYAIASTYAQPTVSGFVQQRRRWASKKFSDLNTETKLTSLTVFFFSLFLLILPFTALVTPHITFFNYSIIQIWMIIFVAKCIIDFWILYMATSFFREKTLLLFFLPEQIIYLFYIVIIGLMGRARTYSWKERTYNE